MVHRHNSVAEFIACVQELSNDRGGGGAAAVEVLAAMPPPAEAPEEGDAAAAVRPSCRSMPHACLDELTRFCSRRSQLVCRYLPTYAAEFRKHEFEHDRRALLLGRLGLVQGRRARPRARPPP